MKERGISKPGISLPAITIRIKVEVDLEALLVEKFNAGKNIDKILQQLTQAEVDELFQRFINHWEKYIKHI